MQHLHRKFCSVDEPTNSAIDTASRSLGFELPFTVVDVQTEGRADMLPRLTDCRSYGM
jgi:hypothetical protein